MHASLVICVCMLFVFVCVLEGRGTYIGRVCQNHTFIGIYGIFGREITIHTVICGVYIRFWPTLYIGG
jgi:hypothetical protein